MDRHIFLCTQLPNLWIQMESVGEHISFEKVLTPQERAVGRSWRLEPDQRIRNVGFLPIYTEDQDAVGRCRTQLKYQLPRAGFPYPTEVTTTLPLMSILP